MNKGIKLVLFLLGSLYKTKSTEIGTFCCFGGNNKNLPLAEPWRCIRTCHRQNLGVRTEINNYFSFFVFSFRPRLMDSNIGSRLLFFQTKKVPIFRYFLCFGGNNRTRTYDILLVRQALSQLSYAPLFW